MLWGNDPWRSIAGAIGSRLQRGGRHVIHSAPDRGAVQRVARARGRPGPGPRRPSRPGLGDRPGALLPGQFAALRDHEIDIAVTSPDNVLLYATTDRNPLGEQLPVRMVRAIDRGLGLTLVTAPTIDTPEQLGGTALAVDVVRSGFAMLLFTMLDRLGIDRRAMEFPELGSTPMRLAALLEGRAGGTILNAESRISALGAGLRPWSTSADVAPNYLGTVVAVPAGFDADLADALVRMWDEATAWLLSGHDADVRDCLGATSPVLGTAEYLDLVRDPAFGLLDRPVVDVDDLRVLTAIRRDCGAYAPDDAALPGLVGL